MRKTAAGAEQLLCVRVSGRKRLMSGERNIISGSEMYNLYRLTIGLGCLYLEATKILQI